MMNIHRAKDEELEERLAEIEQLDGEWLETQPALMAEAEAIEKELEARERDAEERQAMGIHREDARDSALDPQGPWGAP